MHRIERWCIGWCASLVCATAACAAVLPAAPAVQQGSVGTMLDATYSPPISMQEHLALSTVPLPPTAHAAPLPATAVAGADEEAGASLGQILASWALVAFIVLRRVVD